MSDRSDFQNQAPKDGKYVADIEIISGTQETPILCPGSEVEIDQDGISINIEFTLDPLDKVTRVCVDF